MAWRRHPPVQGPRAFAGVDVGPKLPVDVDFPTGGPSVWAHRGDGVFMIVLGRSSRACMTPSRVSNVVAISLRQRGARSVLRR